MRVAVLKNKIQANSASGQTEQICGWDISIESIISFLVAFYIFDKPHPSLLYYMSVRARPCFAAPSKRQHTLVQVGEMGLTDQAFSQVFYLRQDFLFPPSFRPSCPLYLQLSYIE